MSETTTPHPLAIEAAEKMYHQTTGYFDNEECATIIHTTALEPVLKAGEEMDTALERMVKECLYCIERDQVISIHRVEFLMASNALTQWRTLTSPEKANPTTDQNL